MPDICTYINSFEAVLTKTCKVGIIVSFVVTKKLLVLEVKSLIKNCTSRKEWGKGSEPGL